ncbi:hypothetical protein KKF91_10760 [Myxococcota bacterium]|nr:hypothetical protein [Myxococcota bacterium]MBU1431012.1 hypothetical protein [Myxococcota bacterium]MBU1898447.1 hypothetical protein [Myxococcota bacterium]
MNQSQGSRKRRGRPLRTQRVSKAAEYQAKVQDQLNGQEDANTFWARSNVRLGMEAGLNASGQRRHDPVEFPCAVCGVWVSLERWPKDRHDVRCDQCKSAVGVLLKGDEAQAAQAWRAHQKAYAKGRLDGLPELTEEDLEAMAELRAQANNMGNGRVGNRRGKGGSAPTSRRKPNPRRISNNGQPAQQQGQQRQPAQRGRRRVER